MSGDSRPTNSALDTISAAAAAIALADTRVPQASVRKRRWGEWFSVYWCFGAPRNRNRIGHIVPETTLPGSAVPRPEYLSQPPAIELPFIAPPSSPASFLQSEPPSAAQSPVGLVSLTSVSASMYSPGGPSSIFAIGPYAHETQLVSPPVFSTFTTEPSTAPFTPPAESVHLTTPSSPEVPFARLLGSDSKSSEPCLQFQFFHNEFQSYHFQPGSPIGQLISPSSGTSSPFPDRDFSAGSHNFLEFRTGNPPKLLNLDKLSNFDWGSRLGSGSLTPDSTKPSTSTLEASSSSSQPSSRCRKNGETAAGHRVSFELKTEDVVRREEKKIAALAEAVSTSVRDAAAMASIRTEEHAKETMNREASSDGTAPEEDALGHQKHRSITLGSSKDFNFDSVDSGDSHKPCISSDWWANEKVAGNEAASSASQNWSFFPMVQPSVS